jgi:uridylate kinase
MRVVLKIGHALFKGNSIDLDRTRETAGAIMQLHNKGHKIIVVAGGGELSRSYIEVAKRLGADLATCDEIGIWVTRLNALILSVALGEASSRGIIRGFEDLEKQLSISESKILVAGGFTPAQSTDAVAALIAERTRADLLVKTTDVDGVYDSDPDKNPDAKMLGEVSIGKLKEILMGEESKPGKYKLLDMVSLSILERSKIPTVIVNGSNPENILKAVLGVKVGTRITY